MINVQEIRRNVINVVKNYSEAQVKVRKATSNEPWGPSSTLMSEIADLTNNVVAFSEIMQIIWKRLNDHGKNWRHVYKALVLLEYLIKTGSEKVAQQCRDNLFAIQTLKDFQYFEDNKDHGLSIREKSKLLVNLLKDEEKLKTERARAMKAKERFAQSLSYAGTSPETSDALKASTSYHDTISPDQPSSSRSLDNELENTRPQTVGEEELQLQIALAMSKEEAENEERLRKNDDIRLKLALEESEKNNQKKLESRSAVDDLLSLNSTPMPVESGIVPTDPWGAPMNNITSLLPSPPKQNKPLQDPWGTSAVSSDFTNEKTSFDDPWTSNPRPVSANNDPWNVNEAVPSADSTKNDPWNSVSPSNASKSVDFSLGTEPQNPVTSSINDSIRRTPESFLGPNSNLVNLDALVSSKTQTSSSPSNNPFASAVSPASNPFQSIKPSQPTINELRAQNNQLGAGTSHGLSYANASGLESLFNSTQPTSVSFGQNNFATTNSFNNPVLTNNSSAWGNFSTPTAASFPTTSPISQNNPFGM